MDRDELNTPPSKEERLANSMRQHPEVHAVRWFRGKEMVRFYVLYEGVVIPEGFAEFYGVSFRLAWVASKLDEMHTASGLLDRINIMDSDRMKAVFELEASEL